MKFKSFSLILAVTFSLTMPVKSFAYDEAGHHAIVYAMARKMGFSVKEAALIADASQSLDDHDITTAYSPTKLIADYLGANRHLSPGEKPYIINGQVYHSLTSPENRALIEQMHIDRINKIKSNNLPEGEKRRLSLIYMGEYLHFVADEVVHPAATTVTGHGPESVAGMIVKRLDPDHAESDPDKLKRMMMTMQNRLVDFRDNTLSAPTNWQEVEAKVNDPNAWSDDLKKIQDVVVNCWKPTILDKAQAFLNYVNIDREKELRIVDNLRKELEKMDLPGGENGELPYHVPIPLDINGDPPGAPHDINDLGFYYYVSTLTALKDERAKVLESELSADKNRLKQLLQSLGGIALDPDLTISGMIGKPRRITINEEGLVLQTTKKDYAIPGIDFQSFVAILKTMAAGEIPYISIGTEPSGRYQYAKVSYASALKGTREGNMLYQADIQFKAVFMHYPFGYDYSLNTPADPLFSGFPGRGGEAVRFWIASDGIVLKAESHNRQMERAGFIVTPKGALEDHYDLVLVKSGMQILSETYLQGQPVRDEKMDAYTKHLTANWNQISVKLPEFQNIENLAVITALVSWIRKNRVEIDEVFWTIPLKGGYTPDYTAYVMNKNMQSPIELCGGISLLPEFKNKGLAYKMQFGVIKKINEFEYKYGKGWGRVIFCFVSLFTLFLSVIIPTLLLWILANSVLNKTSHQLGFKSAFKNTMIMMLLVAAFSFLISPIIFSKWIGDFDKKLLALLFTFFISPVLSFIWIKFHDQKLNGLYTELLKNTAKKRIATFLFCLMPVFVGFLFNSITTLTTVSFGVVPTTKRMTILDFELIPVKTVLLSNPVTLFKEGNYESPFVNTQQNAVFKLHGTTGQESDDYADQLSIFLVNKTDTTDVRLLKPVQWPMNYPINANNNVYTFDGKPPY